MQKVTAAIIEKNNKILIAKRKKIDPLKDKWEFPGGKVEQNETPEECLKRELREELAIDAEIGTFLCSSQYEYDHISIELMAYRVTRFAGEIKSLVHDEIKWVSLADLQNHDFPEADVPILKKLLSL